MKSLDDELAEATSNLTVGPSPITKLDTSFVMPPQHKLHPNLYNNSMRDIAMDVKTTSLNTNTSNGVPGFPDFPDMWTGESSSKFKQHKSPCCTPKRKKVVRKAVNTPFGSTTVSRISISKTIKLKKRAERKLHRLEKCIRLNEKRRRKKDMGDLCRSMAGMCK
ncbi:hypothetical protein ACHAWO_012203 [Cyclotella atomus]|uniref:Uncharacterized protein n=1 Tax=Cyclotella atomus TaxID=382360 RepID=A0ABD3PD02_9STRA